MFNQMEQIVILLEELNQKCNSEVIQATEFLELKNDLIDYSQVLSDLTRILSSYKSLPTDNVDEVVALLIQLHLKLSDTVWHIDQVHSLVKRMAGNYRETVTDSQ
ncbi:hypothetical protein EDM59_12580 [Brevibacillus nitrificans]|uniref:Uncharacterized protein n=1 Tax=Brevibacillus nitrificans TaxID=651560 RepID=A0A3M8DAS0_9BACL|nr:hypothetical protein [Brevibacillus nitrificans]RNB85240.1 hypothetical protein EDM59_12580 [Brevibacillus nitrificans]